MGTKTFVRYTFYMVQYPGNRRKDADIGMWIYDVKRTASYVYSLCHFHIYL